MNLLDVDVLVYGFRADAEDHASFRDWLDTLINGQRPFAVAETVLTGFLRVVTHPRVFASPSPLSEAVAFTEALRSSPECRLVRPSARCWETFVDLCEAVGARGNLVPDAWLAALAIDSGCTWITTDRDFARFPGLRWRHPLRGEQDIVNPAV